MKFIVTGGAGFIGHQVVAQLEELGHQCVIIDNHYSYGRPRGQLNRLFQERESLIDAPVYQYDLQNHGEILQLLEELAPDTDCIIHLAGPPNQKAVTNFPVTSAGIMSAGLVNLLEQTRVNKIPKFVYVSSSMVYGDYLHDTDEEDRCQPNTLYGALKLAGEHIVQSYKKSFDTVIVRPSAVYGERDTNDRVVARFLNAALSNSEIEVLGEDEVLDFTHVNDAARGIVLAAVTDAARGHIYNITRSDSSLHSLYDAAILATKVAGGGIVKILPRDTAYPRRGRLSITKARDELGFDPHININEGFAQYANWLKNPIR